MPVVDTMKVVFEAEWTGSTALEKMKNDMKSVEKEASNIDAAFKSGLQTSGMPALDGISDSSIRARVQLGALQAKANDLRAAMENLGRQTLLPEKHKEYVSLEKATQLWKEYGQQLSVIEPQIAKIKQQLTDQTTATDKVAKSTNSTLGSFRTMALRLFTLGVSAKAVVSGFRAIGQMGETGAMVRQLAISFDYLAKSVYKMPNLLQEMKEASRGTISDMSLMSSFLTLVAGTSEKFGATLANNAGKLLEIAKAANVLNPALGDTQFFFESIAKGIKRSEIRLLDNLGIVVKVGEANRKYAEAIGKSVTELTAEEKQIAILNETLRVGGQLIDQVGGKVDSLVDPYTRLTAQAENFTNNLKEAVSISMEPLVTWLGRVLEAMNNAAAASKDFKNDLLAIGNMNGVDISNASTRIGAINQLGEEWMRQPASRGDIQARQRMINDQVNSVVQAILDGSTSVADAKAKLNAELGPGGWASISDTTFVVTAGPGLTTGKIFGFANDIERNFREQMAEQRSVEAIREANRQELGDMRDIAQTQGEIADAEEEAAAAAVRRKGAWTKVSNQRNMNDLKAMVKDNLEEAQAVKRVMEQQAAIFKQAAEIRAQAQAEVQQALSQSWIDIFSGGDVSSDLVIGDLKNLGVNFVQVTNQTKEQKESLDELKDAYEKAAEKVRDLELGIGLYGVEQEDAQKKMEKARGEMQYYADAVKAMESGITTSTQKVVNALNVDDIAVYKEFISILGTAGAGAGELSKVSVALGLIDQDTANAIEKMGILKLAIENLGQINFSADPAAAKEAIDQIISTIEGEDTVVDIQLKVRAEIQDTQAAMRRDQMLPEEDRQMSIDLDANLDPWTRSLGQALGDLPGAGETRIQIDANAKPFLTAAEDARNTVDAMNATISVWFQQMNTVGTPNTGGGQGTATATHTGTYSGYTAAFSPTAPVISTFSENRGGYKSRGKGVSSNGAAVINITYNNYGVPGEGHSRVSTSVNGGGITAEIDKALKRYGA